MPKLGMKMAEGEFAIDSEGPAAEGRILHSLAMTAIVFEEELTSCHRLGECKRSDHHLSSAGDPQAAIERSVRGVEDRTSFLGGLAEEHR